MIRKISGKGGGARVKHLVQNGQSITNPKSIADTIAQTISRNSSSQNCTGTFQRVKARKARQQLNFRSNNGEEYNKLFTIEDLKTALKKSHDTNPSPDEDHYRILKHLPDEALENLLSIFNHIRESGDYPYSQTWQR